MTAYLVKFIFYTAGVIGMLLIAFVVAKGSLYNAKNFNKKNGNLEIEESLQISQRKTLHIVRAFGEKFLIASDQNSTTFLAKLNSDGEIPQDAKVEFSEYMQENTPAKKTSKKNNSVIQSMLEKLNN